MLSFFSKMFVPEPFTYVKLPYIKPEPYIYTEITTYRKKPTYHPARTGKRWK